jgi:hypothetical protein
MFGRRTITACLFMDNRVVCCVVLNFLKIER